MKKKQYEAHKELPYFYAPNITEVPLLNEEESRHLARVLRLTEGDEVIVTNGQGKAWKAIIEESNPKQSKIALQQLLTQTKTHQPAPLHIAIAPTKNIDRIEWLIEKCVEIGTKKISLIQTEKTVRNKIPQERLERLMISAMKQSQKWQATEIKCYRTLSEFLQDEKKYNPDKCQRFIAYCGIDKEKKELSLLLKPKTDTTILIGPEGDFTTKEVETAKDSGFLTVSLGEERLRTETAGLYAAMTHHIINQLQQK